MDVQGGGEFNLTDQYSVKYNPVANMIFQNNKTLILVTKQSQHSYSSSQQMALLAGMAFIGGIVAGLLIRCLYFGIVKYFVNNVDQLVARSPAPQGNPAHPNFVDDSFRMPNDEPPDYVTVVTDTRRGGRGHKDLVELKVSEEDMPPPTYVRIVSSFGRVMRSAST